MTERQRVLAKIMMQWDEECPDVDPRDRQTAVELFELGLEGLNDTQLDDLKKTWFDD